MKSPSIHSHHAFVVLRALTGIIFISHGAARLHYSSVANFGGYLEAKGLPLGLVLAWGITLGEMISGSLLALGIAPRVCAVFHGLIIMGGIAMVHLPNGWFVVGHGTGGVEYSLLLLAVLFYIFSKGNKQNM